MTCRHATSRSALRTPSGSTIRGVGTGGSNPLAPTTYAYSDLCRQLDVALEARPAGESVFGGNGELRARQRRWCRHDREASNCGAIGVLQVAEQVLRETPDLL